MKSLQDDYWNNPSLSKGFIGAWMIVLTLVAIYIRLHGADNYHYSDDENIHVWIANSGSLWMVLKHSLYEVHPPLGHILRHYWMEISDKVWFVRSLSLLFGIAMIPLYYAIGKLLKNPLTGMCCALLITFGYGSIIQSYVARNYSMLLFFASYAMYYYLLWRRDRQDKALLLYTLYSVLACLTHFSGIFVVFSIALYETIEEYLNKEAIRQQLKWAFFNIFIAFVAVAIYVFWMWYGFLLDGFFETSGLAKLLLVIAFNPLKAMGYLFPSIGLIPLLVFFLFLPTVHRDVELRRFLHLTAIALILGMFLVAIKHYYPAGTRHGAWVLPFIIPAAGWILANGISECAAILQKKYPAPWLHIAVIGSIALCMLAYDPYDRFHCSGEYQMTEKQWQEVHQYLDALDSKSIVVDAITLVNMYDYLDQADFRKKDMAISMPYGRTHILFNAYYRRMIDKDVLIHTMQDAESRHLLDGVDNIIFMKTIWDATYETAPPLPYMITCNTLEKKIVSFPSFTYIAPHAGKIISEEEKLVAPVAFMEISKKELFEQVIPQQGAAHKCLGTDDAR